VNVLVKNCFHWVGFHVVNRFIMNGYHVDGIHYPNSFQKDYLSLFLGRNSNFSLVDQGTGIYDLAITINTAETASSRNKENGYEELTIEQGSQLTTIFTPLLFGEWMQMNEEGIYISDEHVLFRSNLFLDQAVYIKDFTQDLYQLVKTTNLPSTIDMSTKTNLKKEDKKLDNTIFIRDNIPIRSKLEHLLAHYEKFENYYERFN